MKIFLVIIALVVLMLISIIIKSIQLLAFSETTLLLFTCILAYKQLKGMKQ